MSQPPYDPSRPADSTGAGATSGSSSGDTGSASGSRAQDQPTYGQPSYGQPTYGQPSYEQPSYGQQQGTEQPPYNQQPGWSQPPPAGYDVRQTEAGYAQMYGEKPRTGLAIAALVLGILGLLASPWPIASYVGVVLAVLAVIFGIIAVRRTHGKGMAIAGLILGGIALLVSIIASIFWTNVLIDVIDITQQCIDDTGADSGPVLEQCITDRYDGTNPFG